MLAWVKKLLHLKRPVVSEGKDEGCRRGQQKRWRSFRCILLCWTWVWVGSQGWRWKKAQHAVVWIQKVVLDWASELNKTTPLLYNLSASTPSLWKLYLVTDLASLWDNSPEQVALIINTGAEPILSAHSSSLGCDGCTYEWVRKWVLSIWNLMAYVVHKEQYRSEQMRNLKHEILSIDKIFIVTWKKSADIH